MQTPERPDPAAASPPAAVRASRVRPIGFSTGGLPVRQQFEAWRDHCSSVVDLIEGPASAAGYDARFAMWSFGHFALSHVVAPPTRFRRTARHARRDGLDHWMIHMARSGSQRFHTSSADIGVQAGQPHIMSLDQAIDGERSDVDWHCLFVSRDAFPALGPTIDACRHAPLHGALGGLLTSYIGGLASSLSQMTEAELPRAAEATRAVVAACMAPELASGAEADAHVDRARLARVRQIIRQNLRSTRLGPARLGKLAGMSRSQLYRLFEPFGGVARYIQAERLRQAHRALAEPADTRDIIRVAEDFCFFDPSAFSRAFRREFGCSPTELRNAALAGCAIGEVPRPLGTAAQDFAGALRKL